MQYVHAFLFACASANELYNLKSVFSALPLPFGLLNQLLVNNSLKSMPVPSVIRLYRMVLCEAAQPVQVRSIICPSDSAHFALSSVGVTVTHWNAAGVAGRQY